ncbi:MAG: DUF4231 domain-containing protein [Candidatus Dormibacteria bacterium]
MGDLLELPAIPGLASTDPVLVQVDASIKWYDTNARRSMRIHFGLRTTQLVLATLIPISQVFDWGLLSRVLAAVLAGGIALCQGLDSLHHYGEHYVGWRATAQRMLRERFLFSAHAGEYEQFPALSEDARQALAANVNAIEAQESQSWQSLQAKTSSSLAAQPGSTSQPGGAADGLDAPN